VSPTPAQQLAAAFAPPAHLPGVVVQWAGLEHPAEVLVSHCGTGNTPSPRFSRETYHDHLGYASHTVVLSCMDCGTELVRYSRLRRLVKPKTRLSWRNDEKYQR